MYTRDNHKADQTVIMLQIDNEKPVEAPLDARSRLWLIDDLLTFTLFDIIVHILTMNKITSRIIMLLYSVERHSLTFVLFNATYMFLGAIEQSEGKLEK